MALFLKFLPLILALYLLPCISLASSGPDWLDEYRQCVAMTGNEANCYAEISDFLSTEEGMASAREVGFRRLVALNDDQLRANGVASSHRLQSMVKAVGKILELGGKERNPVEVLCLESNLEQLQRLSQSVDEQARRLPDAHEDLVGLSRNIVRLEGLADFIFKKSGRCGSEPSDLSAQR